MENPIVLLLLIAVSLYVAKLWFDDLRMRQRGEPHPKALPGSTRAPARALVIAAIGGLVLVLVETWGEQRLGISEEQTKMTLLFAAYTLVAPFVEEIIFRGFLVVENRGAAVKWAVVLAASLVFALLHGHFWTYEDSTLTWHFTEKAWFTTGALFAGSLWFYFVRFAAFNPQHSLAPCFAAHLAKNAGVIAIKAVQGHLVGLY